MREATAKFICFGGLASLFMVIVAILVPQTVGKRYFSVKDWMQEPRNVWGIICLILGLVFALLGAIALLSI